MSNAEYEAFLNKKDSRGKLLDDYEPFVKKRLQDHPAASSAQLHDWLKEQHKDIPYTSAKTVSAAVHIQALVSADGIMKKTVLSTGTSGQPHCCKATSLMDKTD